MQQFYGETQKKMLDAAKAMKLTAKDLMELQIIDEIIKEPLGGAHREKNLILQNLRASIKKNLELFQTMSPDDIFDERKNKFLKIGRNKGFMNNLEDLSSLKPLDSQFNLFFKSRKFFLSILGLSVAILISIVIFL